MMRAWTRMLLILLTSACAAGGTSDVQGKKNKRNKTEFTLQLLERNINGQAQAVLMLCQKYNCMNPLRDSDGSEFYFQDHAEAYNTFTQKNGIGSKVKFALLGIAAVTGAAGIILLIRHGLISRKLDKYFPIVDEHGNKVSSKTFKNKNVDSNSAKYYVSRGDGTLSDEEVKNRNEMSDWFFGAGVAGVSIGTIAWMTAFAQELSTNPHWRRKQKDFEKLFVQGERITVNKQELAVLLQVMNKKLGIQIAPNVTSFLYTR